MNLTLNRHFISLTLIFSLIVPAAPTVRASEQKEEARSFESILLKSQSEMDLGQVMPEEAVQKFAVELLEANITVADIDHYVMGKLTQKEYREYQKQSQVMMKGLNPEQMTANEFSQVVSRALEVTQPKALTWSSCSTLTVGILVAVAAVVVGIIAIAKRKIDRITEQGLYNEWQNNRAKIQSQYNETKTKLNDPQGYFNSKISSAQSSISSLRSDNYHLENKIDDAESRIRYWTNQLYYADTDSERDEIRRRINSYQDDIDRYQREIRDNNREIGNLQDSIIRYQNEKIRYMDPQVVERERAANEAWLPQALLTADQNYRVSLSNMPVNNDQIDRDNVRIAKTKKTLGIIAGVGGGVSLALILAGAGNCN